MYTCEIHCSLLKALHVICLGRKIDSWFSINWKTGDTRKIQSFDELKKTCPITSTDNWFIGRTGGSLTSSTYFTKQPRCIKC